LEAFDGRGMVRVLEYVDGAVLLERLVPGRSLFGVDEIDDEEATAILAEVIARIPPVSPLPMAVAVSAWSDGFRRYTARRTEEIPPARVDAASGIYTDLCTSQSSTRLLHGDLHHHNVLLDDQRGWLAVDPKSVIGELEYEVGARFGIRSPAPRFQPVVGDERPASP
jgi:streptomycin 6-kinase